MVEILSALAAAAQRCGVATELRADSFPPANIPLGDTGDRPEPVDDGPFVVIPHEFFPLVAGEGGATSAQLARTVGVCVEQPGTEWFEITCAYAGELGGMLAIHGSACRELRKRGIPAVHLPLGYVPEWDVWGALKDERPIDVTYLGGENERRDQVLAGYASTLWARRQRIVIARLELKPGPGPSFLVGRAKHDLLSSTRVMINVHRGGASGLEWVRVLEAMANGAVVVSEHSRDASPLEPGEHYISGRVHDLATLADLLLEDEARLEELRRSAYEFIRSELPIERSVERLLAVADRVRSLARLSRPLSTAPVPPQWPHAASRVRLHGGDRQVGERDPAARVAETVDAQLAPLRAAIEGLTIDLRETQRTLARLEHATTSEGRLAPVDVAQTDAYSTVSPRVSVLVSLYNHERDVLDALESVAASEHDSYEVLILDDASADASLAVARSFVAARPWFPARLVRHRSNQGLGVTRNALAKLARGELLFILDPDNLVYPPALARLETALLDTPQASLAYSIGTMVTDGRLTGLVSAHAWHAAWLRGESYIETLVMLRRRQLSEIGGYCEDPRLAGNEDYDLLCRFADVGRYGIHVPQILTVCRRRSHGMLESLTKLDVSVVLSLIMARAPNLFSPGFAAEPYAVGQGGLA